MRRNEKIAHEAVDACSRSADAPACLAGELSVSEQMAFEKHVAECPVCARHLENARRTLDVLRTAGVVAVRRDLAPQILARLNAPRSAKVRAFAFRYGYAAAAGVLLLLGGTWWVRSFRQTSPPVAPFAETVVAPPAADRLAASAQCDALAWLCRTQESDGSWNVEEWGGDKKFGVALSSFAVLAILGSEPHSMEEIATVRNAAACLAKQQSPTGEFGPSFSSAPYNQGIATLALLRAFEVLHDESLKPSIDRAVAVIRGCQMPEGGWGYWGDSTQESNLSVTLWQLEALRLAVSLGWDKAQPNVRRAVLWVASVADDRGMFGYRRTDDFPAGGAQTLAAMGAMAVLNDQDRVLPPARREQLVARVREAAVDSSSTEDYYRAYFLATAMKAMQDDASAEKLAMVQELLARRQVAVGPEKGSWDPDRRWGGVGGRIYATALASLSL